MKQTKKSGLAVKRNVLFLFILLGLFLLFVGFCPEQGMAGRGSLPAQTVDQVLNKKEILAKAATITIPFVKNDGQFAGEVTYAADLFAGRFFLTNKELVYVLRKLGENEHVQPGKRRLETDAKKRSVSGKGLVFREFFVNQKGAKIDFRSAGEGQAETVVSYFKGSDPSRWRSGVASYQGVSLGQVYPGVEVKLKASGGNIEKVFYVGPRGKVDAIRIGVAGVAGLKIAKDGRLMFKNDFGELAMRAPIAWQEIAGKRCDVKASYRLLGKTQYGFSVTGSYDKNHTLIIDPELDTLMASTYLGGSKTDWTALSHSLALDSSGNVYVAGYTLSSDFPTTYGAYDRAFSAYWHTNDDSFISKFNGNLTELLASTYLGGSYGDDITSLALDSAGNVYVTGSTNSADFPTTPGAFDRSTYELNNIFISKLDSGLTNLLASTYFGGSFFDRISSLALDSADNVYITGLTDSKDFPTTSGAYKRTYNNIYSCAEVYISKLDGSLSTLLASTFLGQADCDGKPSLALDNAGNVFLTGMTYSKEFPTTPGAYDRSNDGYTVAFVSKMNGDLTELLASTFLGGDGWNWGRSIALGSSGNVYLTGNTEAANFPTTTAAFDRIFSNREAFVSVMNNGLTTLQASTFLGGEGFDDGYSLVLDRCNNVYVAGFTESPDFPITPGAYGQKIKGGDVFVSKLNGSLTKLLASTYLGGIDDPYGEWGYFLVLDSLENVFVAGITCSADFPVSAGSYQTHRGGYFDVFVSKLNTSKSNCLPGILPSINVVSPNGGESWLAGTTQSIAWKTIGTIADVKIEYSLDNGKHWIEVIATTANKSSYPWTVPATPSNRCLVRISNAGNPAISDASDAVFSILLGLDLQVERREIKAFSIMRQYGAIRFLGANLDYPITQYRLMRRKANEGFELLRTISPSELQNGQFQMQDKYLEKDILYTYRVEAFDANGQLIGISHEEII